MQDIILSPAYQRPSGKLILDAPQLNLVNLTPTVVLLDVIPAVYVDGIENVGTHRITPGVAGFYSIVGQVSFSSVVADKSYCCYLTVNGVNVDRNLVHASYATLGVCAKCCQPNYYLSATDFVVLTALSYAGVNTVDVDNSYNSTFLAVQRVR